MILTELENADLTCKSCGETLRARSTGRPTAGASPPWLSIGRSVSIIKHHLEAKTLVIDEADCFNCAPPSHTGGLRPGSWIWPG